MIHDKPFQGSLFAEDILSESIKDFDEWKNMTFSGGAAQNDIPLLGTKPSGGGKSISNLETDLSDLFHRFPTNLEPNESQTEDDLIWPVLKCLCWTASLRQQNLSAHGHKDIPDGLLFADSSVKEQANRFSEEWKRYELGSAVVESKRWMRRLDHRSGQQGEKSAPSTQMLRYLRRVDDLTTGKLRWGILTNGAHWRLYYSGAQSVSEQFFEIDLAAILNIPGHNNGSSELSAEERQHWFKVFVLIFRRDAFLEDGVNKQTFHQRAIAESRIYQDKVAANLSDLVFERVFPEIASEIAKAEPAAPLPDVREAALVLLYRLLFILYAEDRNLLPVRDSRYEYYSLREKVRHNVRSRKDRGDSFSETTTEYWSAIDDLCRAIDRGGPSMGLPPYNGGLFDRHSTPLLKNVRLGDAVIADVIDSLSFVRTDRGRHYINYRDLGVQQLGSIYERLLEQEIGRDGDTIATKLNIFARKNSGSYYTPDDLVGLIIKETIEPLIEQRVHAFKDEAEKLGAEPNNVDFISRLKRYDPAENILDLKICDPAMGSGHFLVNLVDHLADHVITAMAEAETLREGYISPLAERIDVIRTTIMANAEDSKWAVDLDQLDDRHIIRRMVLKRCVYGVDKNPLAVELAKVSLWLHTFTVGAPLSFLDHHLRCGDSLFGAWVLPVINKFEKRGNLFLDGPLNRAIESVSSMKNIEGLTDADIAEAHKSTSEFDKVSKMTKPLKAFLSLNYAFEWMNLQSRDDKTAYQAWLDGMFGDPIDIAQDVVTPLADTANARHFASLLETARTHITEQRFLHWQVEFPGVWMDWEEGLEGGFDALIGNPPWDRMKLQQVEWFAARRSEIAQAQHAEDRKRMINNLMKSGDPLSGDYVRAQEQAVAAPRMARKGGDYPLLSGGDMNLYSLFVERTMKLVKPNGMVGLLVPSGIASDKTAAKFFKGVATEGRLKALYDFENRRTRYNKPHFFPDVDSRFKFCIFVASPSPLQDDAKCAFFIQDKSELNDPDRCFSLTATDFACVNPNTGTAPIFRTCRDAKLTTEIYGRLPVLVDYSKGEKVSEWPVKYMRMFDMTNDSSLFRTRAELEETEGAWPVSNNRFESSSGEWVPLYEGKMIHAFDHRASSITINPASIHNPAYPKPATPEQHQDPNWFPNPRFWVLASECGWFPQARWTLGFMDICNATNMRTFIATLLPAVGFGNKVPLLKSESTNRSEWLLVANLNAMVFDYVVRQKVQAVNMNLYIVEQLPIVPPEHYETVCFGPKTAKDIVREAVLELTYSAHDMAPFARDMGYMNKAGEVLPPFSWDDGRRQYLRAKLDALYFHLYGVTDRNDIRYIYSTFPIVRKKEHKEWGCYRSRDLCLAWMNALTAGNPDAEISL